MIATPREPRKIGNVQIPEAYRFTFHGKSLPCHGGRCLATTSQFWSHVQATLLKTLSCRNIRTHTKIAFDTHTHTHTHICLWVHVFTENRSKYNIYIYIFIYLFAVRTEILIPLMHIWDADQSPAGSMTDAERLQISNGPWEAFVCRKTYVQMQFGDISVLSACF